MSHWLKMTYSDRKILLPSSTLPLLAKTYAPCSAHTLQRSLSVIAEHLVFIHTKVTKWNSDQTKQTADFRVVLCRHCVFERNELLTNGTNIFNHEGSPTFLQKSDELWPPNG